MEFNQVEIFVKSVRRASALKKLLVESDFPSIAIRSGLNQEDCISRYVCYKDFWKGIIASIDLFCKGIVIERVNAVINYDIPDDDDSGRFRTRDLAINFVSTDEGAEFDTASYLNA